MPPAPRRRHRARAFLMRGEFLDLGGHRLYYYAAGSRGAGEPVVLLHGFPTSSHLWRDVVPLLPAGHRVIVLDLLGFGRSDPPRTADVDVHAHADRLIAMLDVLGVTRACIVGHEMGGAVAQSAAVRFPARVSRLCLVDSIALGAARPGMRMVRALAPALRHLPPPVLLSLLRSQVRPGYEDRDRAAHACDIYLRPFTDEAGRDALIRHVRALDPADTRALAPGLERVRAPTTVVWGERDPLLPRALGERLAAAIPGSTLTAISGARHFTPEESAHSVAAAIADLLRRDENAASRPA